MRSLSILYLLLALGLAAQEPLNAPVPLVSAPGAPAASAGSNALTLLAAQRAQELGFPSAAVTLYRSLLAQPGGDRAGLTLALVTALLDDGQVADAGGIDVAAGDDFARLANREVEGLQEGGDLLVAGGLRLAHELDGAAARGILGFGDDGERRHRNLTASFGSSPSGTRLRLSCEFGAGAPPALRATSPAPQGRRLPCSPLVGELSAKPTAGAFQATLSAL